MIFLISYVILESNNDRGRVGSGYRPFHLDSFHFSLGCSSRFQMTLNAVNIKNSSLVVHADDKNKMADNVRQEEADVIVITMPVPQLLNLNGDISTCIDPYREKLRNVSYSSRFALGLFYENSTDVAKTEWISKYVKDNPCLCFISFDSKKRDGRSF